MSLLALLLAAAPDCWSFTYGPTPACDVFGTLQVARRESRGVELAKFGKAARAYSIDLDSDGLVDHVVVTPAGKDKLKTCFVTSTNESRACTVAPAPSPELFVLRWFAQLDDDPMLELFEMAGGEDHSHYTIQKLDPLTWQPTTLVVFNPMLRTEKKDPKETYWGYPWDVRGVSVRAEGRVELLTAEPACVPDDGEEGVGNKPLVFFTGKPTQGSPSTELAKAFKAAKWRTLAELVELAKHPKAKCP